MPERIAGRSSSAASRFDFDGATDRVGVRAGERPDETEAEKKAAAVRAFERGIVLAQGSHSAA